MSHKTVSATNANAEVKPVSPVGQAMFLLVHARDKRRQADAVSMHVDQRFASDMFQQQLRAEDQVSEALASLVLAEMQEGDYSGDNPVQPETLCQRLNKSSERLEVTPDEVLGAFRYLRHIGRAVYSRNPRGYWGYSTSE